MWVKLYVGKGTSSLLLALKKMQCCVPAVDMMEEWQAGLNEYQMYANVLLYTNVQRVWQRGGKCEACCVEGKRSASEAVTLHEYNEHGVVCGTPKSMSMVCFWCGWDVRGVGCALCCLCCVLYTDKHVWDHLSSLLVTIFCVQTWFHIGVHCMCWPGALAVAVVLSRAGGAGQSVVDML